VLSRVSVEVVQRMLNQLPAALKRKSRDHPSPAQEGFACARAISTCSATSINICQATSPYATGGLRPRCWSPAAAAIGLREFNRAHEATREGRRLVETGTADAARYL